MQLKQLERYKPMHNNQHYYHMMHKQIEMRHEMELEARAEHGDALAQRELRKIANGKTAGFFTGLAVVGVGLAAGVAAPVVTPAAIAAAGIAKLVARLNTK